MVPRSVFDNIGLSNDAAAAGAGGVGLPRKSINLDLPEKLRTKLDAFLQADVCKRWETSENGEDVFRMILEVYFDAFDQRVPLNQVAEETFEARSQA